MLARVLSATVNGIEAFPVEVEVNSGWGDTIIMIVGLPDAAVKESRDRVSTALSNSGFKLPMGRTTINLAPADARKEGPSFDLPIAVGMLVASDQLLSSLLDDYIMVGELALTGQVPPVNRDLLQAKRACHLRIAAGRAPRMYRVARAVPICSAEQADANLAQISHAV